MTMPTSLTRRHLVAALSGAALLATLAHPALARKAIMPVPSERPVSGPAVSSAVKLVRGWYGRLEVRTPRTFKGMKVFPLVARGAYKLGDYVTLDEALTSKALVVTELGGRAEVNSLKLENLGGRPVFIMGGEILQGAKQDRMLQGDLVVPPKSGPMIVRAFCTERGRWVVQSSQFKAADAAVPNSVRGAAKGAKEQGAVWQSIDQNQSKLKVSAPTSAAREVYQDRKVVADTKPFVDAFLDLPRKQTDTVGVAVTFGGRLIALDVFGNNALLNKLYPKLLRSYVVDLVSDAWTGDRNADDIRRFLSSARDASWVAGETDGVGTALEFQTGQLHGTGLVQADSVLHTDAFEGEIAKPSDPDRRPTNRLNEPNVQQQRPSR